MLFDFVVVIDNHVDASDVSSDLPNMFVLLRVCLGHHFAD